MLNLHIEKIDQELEVTTDSWKRIALLKERGEAVRQYAVICK